MRTAIAWGAYPVLLGGGLGLTWLLLRQGPTDGRGWETLVVTSVLWLTAALVLVAQRLCPKVEDWRAWRGELATDLLHGVLSTMGGATLARLLFFGVIAWVSAQAARYGWGIWPDAWPLLLQLPLAVLISDFVVYWLHRACHANAWLWRLHELHHSSDKLYALSSGRTHPVYVALSTAVTTGPLLALGADPPTLALMSAFTGINGILQHANLDARVGALGWVLSTCDAHRWHHAVDRAHQNSNFGNNLSIWDRVFGTWHVPEGVPPAVGLGEAYPRGYLSQLVRPFLPARRARGAPA